MAPLRLPLFRRIWTASLLSNLGFMILSVGAAWNMTLLSPRAELVALVQTALMLPMMLFALPAGAIADMYDRRKVALTALVISLVAGAGLAAAAFAGLATPWLLLGFCFLVGTGMALFSPSWQAAVAEQVPSEDLPSAVALNSISFNVARSIGPAIGGLIVAAAGTSLAFAVNTLCYVPLFIAMILWRRTPLPTRLPPERIDRAVSSGVRYAIHSPAIRAVILRTAAIGIPGSAISSLLPLVTRDLIAGQAQTYGILLGAFGIGSVLGAIALPRIRNALSGEAALSLSSLLLALCIAAIGLSHILVATILALLIAGACWMTALTSLNVTVQMSVPRWVAGRALAAYQTAIAGGVAVGSWIWGSIAEHLGTSSALLTSAALLAATLLLRQVWRVPDVTAANRDTIELQDPEVRLALSGRSGPIIIEIEYRVDVDEARAFYDRMRKLRAARLRTGAYDWSIARDIADPECWIERFHCATWNEYLRQRSRSTADERSLFDEARLFHRSEASLRVRRLLERPFGSVRWRDNAFAADSGPPASADGLPSI
ncbi:MFS transporter [Sphingomonas sp. 37zxx]|uniref:MFS transporter n=1 Tax=Sphingomonas sp. 37zxx TaxID=1550073 RepID=UPI002F40CD98